MVRTRFFPGTCWGFVILGCSLGLLARAAVASAAEGAKPAHPRVNVAICYEVDRQWPQRPPHIQWGDMPGIAVSDNDEIYLFTRANPPIQVYDRQGKLLRAFGEGLIGSAHYIRLDGQGNVWVADVKDHVVLQLSPQGKLLRTLGTRGEPGCDATHFDKPTDMAITPDGQIFVADGYGNNRIAHFDRQGRFVKQWGKLGVGPGEFSLPHSIAIDSRGRLYVCDRNNARVQVFDQQGNLLDQWLNLLVPWGVWVSRNDEVWVCGSSPMAWRETDELLSCPPKDQVLMKFSSAGKLLQLWTLPYGKEGDTLPGEVSWLHTVAVDSQGCVYVGDIKGQKAQKLVPLKK